MSSPNHPDGHFYSVSAPGAMGHHTLSRDGEIMFHALTESEIIERGLGHLIPQAPKEKLTVTWQSKSYTAELVKHRFLKCSCTLDSFVWHECSDDGEVLREGIADWREIPGTIMAKAKERAGTRLGCVRWPIS